MRQLALIVLCLSCLGCPASPPGTSGEDAGVDSGMGGTSGTGGTGGALGDCMKPPEGLFTVIEDRELDDVDWEYTETHGNGATVATEPTGQAFNGGVGDSSYRTMFHQIINPDLSDPNCNAPPPDDARCAFGLVVSHEHIAEGATYTPSTDGAVDYIDYEESHIITEPAFDGAAVGWTFALWQAGKRYTYVHNQGSSAFMDTIWATEFRCGLTPQDFLPEPGPDFSETGQQMTFGYVRSNTNTTPAGTQRNVHGIDDFRVVIVKAAE